LEAVSEVVPPLLLVPSERLAETAGDARIRGTAGAESRNGIRCGTAATVRSLPA
jgi:hypothetical protein